MIDTRPTPIITKARLALNHGVMVALFKNFFYRNTVTGPGKGECIIHRTPMPVPQGQRKSTLGQRLLSHTAGLLVLYTYALVILVNRGCKIGLRRDKREVSTTLAADRAFLWALDQEPYVGVRHRFHIDQDTGHRMHYVESGDTSPGSELVIMLHGFPDSYYSYRHQLTSPNLQNAHLIAPDLPGFGGSDSLRDYSPANVLNTIARFVLSMKSIKSHDRCILVGHDWGALVACRLASECRKGIFSRAIIINGVHPGLFRTNINHNITSFTRTAKSTIFVHHPLNVLFSLPRARRDLTRLSQSWQKNIRPIINQVRKSHHIFPFRLPWSILSRRLPIMGDYYLLRQMSKMAKCSNEATYLANALGPGREECIRDAGAELRYGESVQNRKGAELDEMIAYYKDGLSFGSWEEKDKPVSLRKFHQETKIPSVPTVDPNDGASLDESKLGCPAIVIWGSRDSFFELDLVQSGWGKIFCHDDKRGSAVVVLSKSGHWSHSRSRGRPVVTGILKWCVSEGERMGKTGKCSDELRGRNMGGVTELMKLVPAWYNWEEVGVKCYQ